MKYIDKVMQSIISGNYDKVTLTNRTNLKDIRRISIYDEIIARIGCNEFLWKLPEYVSNDIPSDLMEFAINCGCSVFYKVPKETQSVNSGRYTCTPVHFTGCLRNDRTSNTFITSGTDYALTNDDLEKYVIIKNNDFLSCEYDVTEWFSDMLMLTDKAENALIKWCKVHPVGKATTGIESEKLLSIITDMYNGNADYGVIDDAGKILTGSSSSTESNVINLGDTNAVEKMHFLSEFHYELIRRLCNLYNLPFHTTAKSSQNLDSEIHNTDIFSQIISESRLRNRKEAAKKITDIFGFECSVDFSKTFEKENKVIDNNSETSIENVENVSRETNNESEVETSDNT